MKFADNIMIWRYAVERRRKKHSRSKIEYRCVNGREENSQDARTRGSEGGFEFLGSTIRSNRLNKRGKEESAGRLEWMGMSVQGDLLQKESNKSEKGLQDCR